VSIVVVESPTLGEGWLRTSRAILERGALERYDDQPTRELALLTLVVERPSSDDPLIAELGDAEWLAWMHENFFVQKDVAELGNAKSYAVRLFNYAGTGRDQIAWVVERLRVDPACRSASVDDLPAADRHDVHPVREFARLLDPKRRARARRVRAQPRLRQEGLWQPRRAREAARACRG
jgi:hypothetical protein